jgi:heme-degrading monooxygenase HmoA
MIQMTYVLVIHKVEYFDRWKRAYDEHGTVRKANGSKGAFVFRNADDPDQLVVITQWENMESAKNFAEAKDLKEAMQKGGVSGQPEV